MSKSPAPRLGKGLNALLTPKTSVSRETPPNPLPDNQPAPGPTHRHEDVVRDIPLDQISPNPRQPRTVFRDEAIQDLAQSIRARGVVQPIVVRTMPDGRYQLVAGERRWRASRVAERESVPAIIREMDDEQSLEIALIENLQREDLTPIERARAYQSCLDALRVTPEVLAVRLGQSRSNIVNYLRLLTLSDEVIGMIERGELGMGQARAIAGVPYPERQIGLARMAVRKGLSTRQVEEMARLAQQPASLSRETEPSPLSPRAGVDRHLERIEESLKKSLGLRVQLRSGRSGNSGKIVIHYRSIDEFDRLAQRLGIDLSE